MAAEWKHLSRMALAPGIALLLLIGAAACQDPQAGVDEENDGRVATIAQIREDPCDGDVERIPAAVALAFVDESHLENEVHDCQRLVVADSFGPLVGVYPIRTALEQPEAGFSEWTAVASLFNWGEGEYQPLHIEEDDNCLFLRVVDGAWQARIESGRGCGGATLPAATQPNLELVRARYNGPDTAETDRPIYPLTARFGWHPAEPHHYIGIKCGDRWCSIGQAGALPSDTLIGGALIDSMPGYFDVQPMPMRRGNEFLVGPVVRLHPSDSLRRAVRDSSLWRTQVTYASVVLDTAGMSQPDWPLIRDGLNLGRHPPGQKKRCDHGDPAAGVVGSCVVMDVNAGRAQARRWGSFGQSEDMTVDTATGVYHSAPSTVRWRWREPAGATQGPAPQGDAAVERGVDTAAAGGVDAAAAGTLGAAAWIPCQGNNCCTAVW